MHMRLRSYMNEMNQRMTVDAVVQPLRVFVYGGCVSRDVLSLSDSQNKFKLVGYVARTSLASQVGSPWRDDEILRRISSDFQRRMVLLDMQKSLFRLIEQSDFDILLMDLMVDRLPLVELNGGRVATKSNEFYKAYTGKFRRTIGEFTDEYLRLWTRGFEALVDLLERNKCLHKLRINSVFWASRSDVGCVEFPGYGEERILAANGWLSDRYSQIKQIAPDVVFYEYSEELFIADSAHKWGLSPFHFVGDLYRETVRRLQREKNQR